VAVNQVSLFFYPPRWRQRLTAAPRAHTDQGAQVHIADAVHIAGADGPAVPAEELKAWLTERGFVATDRNGSVFDRGLILSIFGHEKEMQVTIGEEACEITDVYCRFTLPRHMPTPLSKWTAFAVSLCRRFHLPLGPNGAVPCTEAEFLAAVRAHRNWREFAGAFGWKQSRS
jgi:hypothetical protein